MAVEDRRFAPSALVALLIVLAIPADLFAQLSPAITSISPTIAFGVGDTRITIEGQGFAVGTSVEAGGVAARDVVVWSSTRIAATLGAHASGVVDVVVHVPGSPDADLEEYHADTHPRGLFTRYFAEGARSDFFSTQFAFLNPDPSATATVHMRFLRPDGSFVTSFIAVPPMSRRTMRNDALDILGSAEFGTVIESNVAVVVDRTMTWDGAGYGSHAETSMAAPATTWYFAEGATHSGFDLFYLLQNPADTDAQVLVRYLLPSGAPLEKSYTIAAHSRFNIWTDVEPFPAGSGNLALASTDVSAVITVTNNVPIIAERAMYLSKNGTLFEAGHESAGVTGPASHWFFAEGATGPFFDTFVLLANPSTTTDAQVRTTYLLPNGSTLTKTYTVAANSRCNIWLDLETFPDGNGGQTMALADTAVSVVLNVLNAVPIVAERSMWWPGPTSATWAEAHNAFGTTDTATRWGFAEGVVLGPPTNTETFFLIANTGTAPGWVRITLLFDDDGASVSKEYDVLPQSRFNVPVRQEFAEAANRGFGAVVESVGVMPASLVVERAMYNDALGRVWAAGSDALGTPLP